MNDPDLQRRIRRGMAFVFLSTMGSRMLSFAADIGLMRLLEVDAFGLLAFGLLVVNTLNLVRSMGIGEALIFRREADWASCDTGFFLALALGLGLYGALFAGAPWMVELATEGDRSLLAEVVRLLGLLVLLQALASVPNALLERALDFEKRFYIDTLPTLVYAGLGLGLALSGKGIWSLVWARLVAALASTVAAWCFSPWRPTWRFSWKRARELGGYGRFVTGGALVSFLVVNVDDGLVVKLTGVEGLGFYARAYLLANLPVTAVAHIIGRVAFPAYSRMRADLDEVRRLYARLVRGVMLICLPVGCSLLFLAEPFALGLFGEKWEPLVRLLPWLGIYGLLRAFLSNTGPLFNALGAPQAILKVNLLQLLVLVTSLYPLVRWLGLEGACMGVLIGTLLSSPLALKQLRSVGGVGWGAQLGLLRPFLMPGLGMGLAMLGGCFAWERSGMEWPLVQLLVCGTCGVGVYGCLLYFRERSLLIETLALLRGEGGE